MENSENLGLDLEKKPVSNENNTVNDNSKLENLIQSLINKVDSLEKNKISANSIKEMASRNVIEREIKKEEENIQLNNKISDWERGKNDWEIRNAMWEESTRQFLNEDISRSRIHNGMVEDSWNSDIGQLLSICLFRYMAPENGISIEELEGISLIQGERSFKIRNNPKEILRI